MSRFLLRIGRRLGGEVSARNAQAQSKLFDPLLQYHLPNNFSNGEHYIRSLTGLRDSPLKVHQFFVNAYKRELFVPRRQNYGQLIPTDKLSSVIAPASKSSAMADKIGISSRGLLMLGHSAALFGMVALFMKDMMWLRSFMICSSCCGVMFNLLQPRPLKVPAMWGCVFILLNIFQIGVLLHERREIAFMDEEAAVYLTVFKKHGMTPHQFHKLIHKADATWLDLPSGHIILKEGDEVESVCVIVKGIADVSKGKELVGEVTAGCMIGETSLMCDGHKAGHTVQSRVKSRVVQWKRDKLRTVLVGDEHLLLCVAQVISNDLATKLQNAANVSSRAQAMETYQEVIKAMLREGVIHPAHKRSLREYREAHAITPLQHNAAVTHCGWTLEEFEDGIKNNPKNSFSFRKTLGNLHRAKTTLSVGPATAHEESNMICVAEAVDSGGTVSNV